MARALNPDQPTPYVLKSDLRTDPITKLPVVPPEEQTRWMIVPLDYAQHIASQNGVFEQRTEGRGRKAQSITRVLSGTQEKDTLLNGVRDVEQFLDHDGKAVSYPTDTRGRMEFWTRVRPADRAEIARAILGESDLDEAEAGS